ncbi:sigma factor SigG regulation protein, partial [Treponema pallidum]
MGFITWVIILFLFAVFPWVFVFFPLGGVFIVLFSQWAFASTGIVSFKEVVFALSRFVLCTVGFSCTAGYISVFWVHRFSTLDMQFVFGFFIVYALFALRDYAFD